MMMKFPSEEEFAKNVAEKALDEIEINGHTVRQWIHIVAEQDCIRRQTAIDACDQSINIFDATDRIRTLPSVTLAQKWIPVSERLPEENDHCLCCDEDGYMTIGYVLKWSKEWCFDDDDIDLDVVAWMPLPTPYKAESEGKE